MLEQKLKQNEHWFFGPVMRCKAIYLQVILASVFINIFALASSVYIMTVYDRVIPNNTIESLVALTAIILVVVAFDFILKIVRSSSIDRAGLRIDKFVSKGLFSKISRHDTNLKQATTGSLANTVRDFDLQKRCAWLCQLYSVR